MYNSVLFKTNKKTVLNVDLVPVVSLEKGNFYLLIISNEPRVKLGNFEVIYKKYGSANPESHVRKANKFLERYQYKVMQKNCM